MAGSQRFRYAKQLLVLADSFTHTTNLPPRFGTVLFGIASSRLSSFYLPHELHASLAYYGLHSRAQKCFHTAWFRA